RARVVSSNDVNEFNNEVQSNIAYGDYVPGAHLRFLVANSRPESAKVELVLSHTLPHDWKVDFVEPNGTLVLEPGETRSLEVEVAIPDALPKLLTAPFNGRIIGSVEGDVSAKFAGTLHRS